MLQTNKSYGLYSCPIDLLKASRNLISESLAYLMNASVSLGSYPSKLKQSKITPIFKSEDESDPNNYRPIALLSIFNGIFEKTYVNNSSTSVIKITCYLNLNMVSGNSSPRTTPS